MQRKSIEGSAEVQAYVLGHSERLEPHHLALIDDTDRMFPDKSPYQVPPEQALVLRMLTRIVSPTRVLEIGTFTGLSAMLIAEGMGPDGQMICLDVDSETGALARSHWERAGLGGRISLRIGPASETLRTMSGDRFDLVFLDADKPGYIGYFEAVLPMLDPGGLIVADNTLLRGTVIDPDEVGDTTTAIRAFNEHVASHAAVDAVIMPVYDGLTLIRKR